MLRFVPILVAASIVFFVDLPNAAATNYTWSNTAGGNWNTAGNWGGGPPGASDNATLGTLAGSYTVQLTDTRSINNFTMNYASATLTVSGSAAWAVGGAANITLGTFNFTGGTVTVNSTFAVDSSATANWSGGTYTGTGTLSGTVFANSGGTKVISGVQFKNGGTLAWTGGTILSGFNSSVALTNTAGATIDLRADGIAFDLDTSGITYGGTLFNSGTILKSAGSPLASSSINWGVNLASTGLINVQVGTLTVNGPVTLGNGGTLTAAAGTTLSLNGGGTLGGATASSITGTGTVAMTGGTFTVSPGVTYPFSGSGGNNLLWTGGTIMPNGVSLGTIGGTLIASSGGTKVIGGTTLQNGGTIAWTGGTILTGVNSTSYLTNLAGAKIDLQADGFAFDLNPAGGSPAGTIYNYGTIQKSAGSPLASSSINWGINLASTGLVNVQVGTLTVNGPVTLGSGGTLTAAAGTTLSLNGGGTLGGATASSITGTGTVAMTGGTFTVSPGVTYPFSGSGGNNLLWTGGTIAPNGVSVSTVGGTLFASSGGTKAIAGITLQNGGTIAWTGGTIATGVNSTSYLTNLPGATIDLRADGIAFDVASGGGSPVGVLYNYGTILKSAGSPLSSSTINWGINFVNGGIFTAAAGTTLNLNAGGTLANGTTTTTGAGLVALSGGTFSVPLDATFTATGSGGANLNWTGASLAGQGTLAGTLIKSGVNGAIVGTTLQNGGTIAWTGGTILTGINSTSYLTNLAGAMIDLRADGFAFDLNPAGGTPAGTIFNSGTILKSAGSSLSSSGIRWAVSNSGLINNAVAGTLNFSGVGGVTNTGTVTMVNGATIGGTINSNSGGMVQGPAAGTGTYSGPLTFNTGSTLQPGGGSPGKLVLSSTLTMNSGSTYSVRLAGTTAGTGYSQTSASGLITLTNPTIVIDSTGYTPDPSAKYFLILDGNASPISGTFNNLPNGSTVTFGNYSGTLNYTGNSTQGTIGSGHDLVLYNVSVVVPEPANVLTIGVIVTGLLSAIRRKRKRSVVPTANPL